MDGYLKQNLEVAKEVILNDWDMVFCVDGYEGAGKSVLAMQCAKFCDPSFTVDRVVFTPKEFQNAINNSEKYQAVVYDEAYTGLSSRATMTSINRALTGMLAEIRQKNLFVFVVMPTYFDLDKYVALWRSRALIHVYTGDKFKRGNFAFFNKDKKKYLYIKGKKFYSYSCAKPNFIGRFTNYYVVDEEEYRKRKAKALKREDAQKEDSDFQKLINETMFEKWITLEDKWKEKIPQNAFAAMLGVTTQTIYMWTQKYKELNR